MPEEHRQGISTAFETRPAMVFRLMQAALIGMSLTLIAAVPDALAQGNASLALQLTAMHATGYDVGLILFGINSLIMARLLILARAVPRIIALGIGASGLVYMTGSTLRLAAPELLTVFEPAYGIPMLAETALALWLLITGRLVRAALQAGPPYPREAARERPSTHR